MNKIHLIPKQRYTISAMYKQGCTQKIIAQAIGKNKSVVSRELKRNANLKGKYSFEYAQDMAQMRKERMKTPRKLTAYLRKEIIHLIEQKWSPQQIEGRLKLENKPFVSHETIYKIIRNDKAKGGTLYQHTRHKLKHRKRPVGKKISIKNRVTIDQRPEIVNTKERCGDWEIDTNGTKFADHQNIAKMLKTRFFFTHPYSPWEKGAVEHSNKLIRQYIPKKTNFYSLNNLEIKQIQYKINNRPREKLNFYSPKEIFFLNLQKSCIQWLNLPTIPLLEYHPYLQKN